MRAWAFMAGGLLLPALAWAQGSAGAPAMREGHAAITVVPDAAAQGRAREMIRGIFKDDFAKTAAADRDALARKLVAEAAGTKDDAAARYVLLSDAADLAAGAGDSETAIAAVAELGKWYAVDVIALKKAALVRASAAVVTPENAEALTRLCLQTADAAALADAFDAVTQLANMAEGAANKTHNVAFVAGIQVHLADLRGLAAEFPAVMRAREALAKNPKDAAAHLEIGKFYALHKGQWDIGLPHLAAGSDAELRGLAEREIAAPADGVEQTALGDAWWDFAEKSTGLTRAQAGAHALGWYGRARESIKGLTLTRIEDRLKTGLPAAAAGSAGAKAVGAGGAAMGNAVNLMALIDPAKDAAAGKWHVDAGTLKVESGKYSALEIPYVLPEEYDLRICFTRTGGEGSIEMLLAARKKTFGFAVDVKGEARFERVNNKIAKDNPTTTPIAISNDHKYTVTVQVRKGAVRALLDDKLITEWKTDYKDMSRYPLWKLSDDKLCGVGANNAAVTFHSVELIEVSGAGKALRGP
jgi:hypothetical protein